VHISAKWEGHTLLKTGLSAHRHAHRHTKVQTVYPPVSLRSLGAVGGYNTRNPAKASGGRPYETRSRNMAATQKNQLLTPVSYSLLQTLFR